MALYHFHKIPLTTAVASSFTRGEHATALRKKMTRQTLLISEITPQTKNWTAKVRVIEKLLPRTSMSSPKKYQRIVLMDKEGTKVQASIFGAEIDLFGTTLSYMNYYNIAGAIVSTIEPRYCLVSSQFQWKLSSRTYIEQLPNDEEFPTLNLHIFTPFDQFGKHVDSSSQIDMVAIVIKVMPLRIQQTRIGASDVQEFTVTDKSLTLVVLTMWDQFVNNEASLIVDKIDSMPIILGTRLKVVSYKGISLTTKALSFFALNPDILEAVDLANWLIEHKEEVLNLLVTNDPDLSLASSSMQPSPQIASPIAIISQPTEKLPRYWAKARVQITKLNQQLWYMACSSCHKNTGRIQPTIPMPILQKRCISETKEGMCNMANVGQLQTEKYFLICLKKYQLQVQNEDEDHFNIMYVHDVHVKMEK
ncbi:Replication protein A subunit [Quillaja saponaria]|uniref:Replication protein A subunit n=1 Tax=Quillaja saponaria TaxID=32244 RepID=A0AAD7M3Z4_QUISA|nr:Replication protein A subunit [Quillaja saponaria]